MNVLNSTAVGSISRLAMCCLHLRILQIKKNAIQVMRIEIRDSTINAALNLTLDSDTLKL